MATGRLEVKEFKKGKAVHIVWTNAKGKPRDEPVTAAQLSADLAALLAEKATLPQLGGVEVEFEEVQGKPQKICRQGEAWQQPRPPAPPPRPGGHGRGGPHQRPTMGPKPAAAARKAVGEFRNPYNFIPAPPRPTTGPLADARPCGHDRFDADRFSGTISVRLTTVTPLLLPDAAVATENAEGHKTLPLRLGPDGRPLIPPTSVKGMLRAAFEAATNSRFGVFSAHDERLAFRAAAQDGLALVPVIVEDGIITLQRGTTAVLPAGRRADAGRIQHAAWLPRYKRGVGPDPLRFRDGQTPAHGDAVWCWAVRVRHRSNRFDFWGVMEIARNEADLSPQPRRDSEVRKLHGRVCITNQNIGNKHDERVFFEDGMQPVKLPLTDDVKRAWRELIRNYQAAHVDDVADRERRGERPDKFLGREPGKTAWSRHVYQRRAENLDDGTTLCHALVRQDGDRYHVEALYPVMISRKLYNASPRDLLEAAGNLTPAASIDQLSPADRVFGWVASKGGDTDDAHAYRGNLRIGPVTCHSVDAVESFGDDSLPLAILGQPKPQQGRFYVAKTPKGEAQDSGLTKHEAGYSQGKGLRGRKVYPHQAHLRPCHWKNPLEDRTQTQIEGAFQEYRRPGGERDNQNRSITGWVRPGAVFTFDIHVTNLSAEELGALLWLLQQAASSKPGCFRLGGGKPLGFGSVRLEIGTAEAADPASCRIMNGEGVREAYRSLTTATPASLDVQAAVEAFQRAVTDAYGGQTSTNQPLPERFARVPFIAALIRSLQGFDDQLPVHYPRAKQPGYGDPVPPHPEGKAYEWFVANDREGRDSGPHQALDDLATDTGLPMLTAPDSRS
jgi:CRISPR-associated protein (TIGR03986 family)